MRRLRKVFEVLAHGATFEELDARRRVDEAIEEETLERDRRFQAEELRKQVAGRLMAAEADLALLREQLGRRVKLESRDALLRKLKGVKETDPLWSVLEQVAQECVDMLTREAVSLEAMMDDTRRYHAAGGAAYVRRLLADLRQMLKDANLPEVPTTRRGY